MTTPRFLPLADYPRYPKAKMQERAHALWQQMNARRTVRDFSHESVPREVIEECIRTAGTAPSGANQQPWHFAVVADPAIKRQIREAAEEEERHEIQQKPDLLAITANVVLSGIGGIPIPVQAFANFDTDIGNHAGDVSRADARSRHFGDHGVL